MSRLKLNPKAGNSQHKFTSKFRNAIWAIFCRSIGLKNSKIILFKTMILSINFQVLGTIPVSNTLPPKM